MGKGSVETKHTNAHFIEGLLGNMNSLVFRSVKRGNLTKVSLGFS